MEEIWRNVKKFEGLYEISNRGKIRGLDRHVQVGNRTRFVKSRNLKSRINNHGYESVRLSSSGTSRSCFVHRLLAEVFVENPKSKSYVNHKNGIKADNGIENLEWVTHSENVKHAYDIGLFSIPLWKCKKVIDNSTGLEFTSVRKASKYLGKSYSSCKNYLNGNRKNLTSLSYSD